MTDDLASSYPELAEAQASFRMALALDCLKGRVILITGAGDGIGRTLAKTCAVYGANLVLLGRTRSKLDAVYDWVREHTSAEAAIVPADLAVLDDAAADALHVAIEEAFGRLDGLVHNASELGPIKPIEQYDTATWQRVMATNINAPFILTKTLLPLMREAEDASIVSISSSVGRKGRAYWGGYAVSKFALEGLTEVLADELESTSVRSNSVNPGGTRTDMRRRAYPGEDPATVPVPEQHMDLLLYLLSVASIGVTGGKFDARTWAGASDA